MRKLAEGVVFRGDSCGVYETRYPDEVGGSRAIVLAPGDPDVSPDNEVLAVATTVADAVPSGLPDDLVVIDPASEGVLGVLLEAGVVEDTGRRAPVAGEACVVARVLHAAVSQEEAARGGVKDPSHKRLGMRDKARIGREVMVEMRRDYDAEADLPADYYDDDSYVGRALSGLAEVEEYLAEEPERPRIFVGMDRLGSRGSLDYEDPVSGVVTFPVSYPIELADHSPDVRGAVVDGDDEPADDEGDMPLIRVENEADLRAWAQRNYDYFDLR